MENLVRILDPFEKATTIVCGDKYPTMHKILPIVVKLLRVIEIEDDDLPVIKNVKSQLAKEINKRTTSDVTTLIACIMNPFTKDLAFLPEEREQAHQILRDLMSTVEQPRIKQEDQETEAKETEFQENPAPLPALPTLDTVTISSPDKRLKSADTEDWLEDVVCIHVTQPNTINAIELEISRYLAMATTTNDSDKKTLTVLECWKENEMVFPRISKIAKKFLAIPASSVSSERVFSFFVDR